VDIFTPDNTIPTLQKFLKRRTDLGHFKIEKIENQLQAVAAVLEIYSPLPYDMTPRRVT